MSRLEALAGTRRGAAALFGLGLAVYAIARIGLPLVPVKARSSYDANTLRDQLLAALSSR